MNTDPIPPTAPEKRGGVGLGSMVLITGIVLMIIAVGIGSSRQNHSQPTGGPAPDFTFTTFEGQTMNLSDLRGQVVVLNFWASWCGPCRVEAPALRAVWDGYQNRGLVMLGIAYADSEPKSLAFIEEFGLTYLNAPDLGARISEAYRIQGVPETFLIDREGNIAEFFYAGVTEQQLSAAVERLLGTQ